MQPFTATTRLTFVSRDKAARLEQRGTRDERPIKGSANCRRCDVAILLLRSNVCCRRSPQRQEMAERVSGRRTFA